MDKEDITKRLESMTDSELVMWRFIFEHLVQIETRLTNMEASFAPRHVPDAEVASIQIALKAELQARTLAKGPGTP